MRRSGENDTVDWSNSTEHVVRTSAIHNPQIIKYLRIRSRFRGGFGHCEKMYGVNVTVVETAKSSEALSNRFYTLSKV